MEGTTRSVGTSALRVEDTRILSGTGRYADDVKLFGGLHVAFVRSPMPHARILSIDTSAALDVDGVVAVYTGSDFAERTHGISPKLGPPSYRHEPILALAVDKVRHVGDPVAMVIATSRYIAEDGAELVDVDYEQLKAVANIDQALDPARPVIFESIGSNQLFEMTHTAGDVDAGFAAADVIVRETFSQHRVAQVPMEGRGGTAEFAAGNLTYHATSQSPHTLRAYVAESLGLDLEAVRVVNTDIGGAFGLKINTHREDLAVCAAAYWLSRPVKWIEDRNEHLLSSGQAREARMELEAAVRQDGTILALRGDLVIDQGAYVGAPSPGGGHAGLVANLMPGPYAIGGFELHARVIASNKCTFNAYRAPWAIETWSRERMLDVIARELDLDPADVRRRNFAPNDGSAEMFSGLTLLGNSCAESLERALEESDYKALRESQAAARAEGRCVGIGFATYIEAAPGPKNTRAGGRPMHEAAIARLEADGQLSIFTSQAPHGQGHETTLAQVAADEFGVPMESVRVHHGDTANTPWALVGTGGSRAATMATGAVLHSSRQLKAKVLEVAAEILEASPADLRITSGVIHPVGVPSVQLSLADVAAQAYLGTDEEIDESENVLEVEAAYDGGLGGWASGTHLCAVEIDLQTGRVDFDSYLVVEDCGRMINPAIVEGQVRGGVAQGVGEVLYEWSAYDDEANYLAASFMDYLLPTASEIPPIQIVHLENEPNEEVFFRGVGEGGLLVAPAAITNAIEDALAPYGARIRHQYLPPAAVLELAGVIPQD
ncbi:MAG: xanthine dehydrogenase family protein [Actinobacteria bacterium]|nr:xanthine dehydrogenase family protein [Actinomycetota bacterium]